VSILGAHNSIAGGYYKAAERAEQTGCECLQIFTKNNNQWRAKEISDEDARLFRQALDELGIKHTIAHDSYLINMASPDKELWRKSVDAFVLELRRAEKLGIPFVVAHPGAYTSGSESGGLRLIVRALNEIHRRTSKLQAQCLLETTAGQGTTLGWQFEQLAAIFDGVKHPQRLGVCFDTCHVFAAGYAMGTKKEYLATMRHFNATVGTKRIKAFHLNDSRRELGARVDRHEHIGRGKMGLEPFRHLLADRRFRKIPMYLETPKGTRRGVDLDKVNLATLRGLLNP
jgi:deoxyribonuclease-4